MSGPPAGREKQRFAAGLGAVVERDDSLLVLEPHGLGVNAEPQLDAVAVEDLRQRIPDLRSLPVGELLRALNERDPGPEAGHELGQLDADGSPAYDDGGLRDLGEIGCLTIRPVARLGEAGDRRHDRVGAGGDDDRSASRGHARSTTTRPGPSMRPVSLRTVTPRSS